jgi:hypothetical protein
MWGRSAECFPPLLEWICEYPIYDRVMTNDARAEGTSK